MLAVIIIIARLRPRPASLSYPSVARKGPLLLITYANGKQISLPDRTVINFYFRVPTDRDKERGREAERTMHRIRIQMQIPKLILFGKTFTLCCIIGPNPFARALSLGPWAGSQSWPQKPLGDIKKEKKGFTSGGKGERGKHQTSRSANKSQ